MKKRNVFICAALLACISCHGCSFHPSMGTETVPEYVFTYAENQDETYPSTQGAYKFAELVKERTNGRIEIQVEPDAALGSEDEVIEQLQFGGIDFARVSITPLSESVPALLPLCMPYLYRDSAHKWAVLDGEIGDKFLNDIKGHDLIGLSWYDAGVRNFYTINKPILKLEDISNMRIRIQPSALTKDMIYALGGIPVTLEFKDVYSALETGEIDGAENNWPSFDSTGHYQIAKYYSLDEHLSIPEVQLCSLASWNRLSREDQEIIQECALESAQYERRLWAIQEKASAEKMQKAGVLVNSVSDEELRRFREASEPLYEKYCSDYMDIITEIKNQE